MPRAPGSANTLPAMTLTGTGAAVGSTANWASSQAAMSVVANNVEYLKIALNEVLVALGQDPLSGIGKPIVPYVDVANGAAYSPLNYANLTVAPAALEDTGGVSSILVTDATAFYASVANAFATLAKAFNDFVPAAQHGRADQQHRRHLRCGARGQRAACGGERRGDDLGAQGRL